eukprot:2131552-Pyramimonas_sp.AAC.1
MPYKPPINAAAPTGPHMGALHEQAAAPTEHPHAGMRSGSPDGRRQQDAIARLTNDINSIHYEWNTHCDGARGAVRTDTGIGRGG